MCNSCNSGCFGGMIFPRKKLTKYFPDDYTAKDMEQVIESLLEKWMQEQSC